MDFKLYVHVGKDCWNVRSNCSASDLEENVAACILVHVNVILVTSEFEYLPTERDLRSMSRRFRMAP